MNPAEELEKISREVSLCENCDLHYSRKNSVPGEGPADAEIMFIGEGPGFHENEQGRPFVGAAGKYLEELLASINLTRSDVYITNVVKCRPPGNRDPQASELSSCSDFLDRQIHIINPKVIVTLGRFSMGKFFSNAKISDVHGRASNIRGRLIVAMYHPAAALHQPSLKPVVEADFLRIPELITQAGLIPEYKEPPPEEREDPTQLSLF